MSWFVWQRTLLEFYFNSYSKTGKIAYISLRLSTTVLIIYEKLSHIMADTTWDENLFFKSLFYTNAR
jgi:hypothetical protein